MRGKKVSGTGNEKSVKRLLAVLIGILAVIIAAGAFLVVHSRMKEHTYSEAIVKAEKYLTANKYEDAIIEYKRAISANPEDEEAYLALADVYVDQEENSKARAVLKKGLEKTSSGKIRKMLSSLNTKNLVNFMNGGEKTGEIDLLTASEDIAWNTSFMQKITGFNFSDYKEQFGGVKLSQINNDKYLEVVHEGLDGICYYRNTDDNKDIVDISRKVPVPSGMPAKIRLNSLGTMFRNFDGGVSLSRLQMFFGEKVAPENKDGMYYIETKTEECIIRMETDAEGNIVSPNAWNEIILLNANLHKAAQGQFSGTVLDAVTGKGVSQAVLTFMPSKAQNKEETAKTDIQGVFSIKLEPDSYTVKIIAEDYIEEEFLLVIEEGKNYSGEQFTISPELTRGTARIVLEWNAEPWDLDSYLTGETDTGKTVSVNYMNKRAGSGDHVIADLDLDKRDGYGPETTTIYDLNGIYKFHVEDYMSTGTMKQQGAVVKVYLPGKEPAVITIDPVEDVKDIWVVCEIDHGELNIINEAQ